MELRLLTDIDIGWIKIITSILNSTHITSPSDYKEFKSSLEIPLRTIAEKSNNGKKAWKNTKRALKMHKWSKKAYSLWLNSGDTKLLNGSKGLCHIEHICPVEAIKVELRKLQALRGLGNIDVEDVKFLISNLLEVVIITKEEAKYLDGSIKNGCLGLQSKMPPGWNGINRFARLEVASIEIAPETKDNHHAIDIK